MTESISTFKSPSHELTKQEWMLYAIIPTVILIVGLIMLAVGLNESFYSADPTAQMIFKLITQLGEDLTFVVIFVILFLVYDKVFARRLLISFMANLYVNSFVKVMMADPRPPTNIVNGEAVEEGYGFPSGHTQLAISIWGYINTQFKEHPKRLFVQIWCIFCMIAIPISRLVIGVHDLQDVIGGYVIGFIMLLSILYLEPRIKQKFSLPWFGKLILGATIGFTLWILGIVLFPLDAYEFGAACGIIVGFTIAVPIEEKYVRYNPTKLLGKQKIIVLILGLGLVLGVYFALSMLFELITSYTYIWRFIRYTLLVIFAFIAVPSLFIKIFKNSRD